MHTHEYMTHEYRPEAKIKLLLHC